jgi:hypothetical protein
MIIFSFLVKAGLLQPVFFFFYWKSDSGVMLNEPRTNAPYGGIVFILKAGVPHLEIRR